MTLKASSLCSRDNGYEIYFTVKRNDAKLRVTYPAGLLNSAPGDDAPEADRKKWVEAQKPALLRALAQHTAYQTDVRVEEIS